MTAIETPAAGLSPRPAAGTTIADMLRAGHSDRAIAKALHTDGKRVAAARAMLGLPKARPGKTAAESLEDAFRSHSTEISDGHVQWTGHVNGGRAAFRWDGRHWSARRAAFEIQHGRPPVGYTAISCGMDDCVAPAHVREIGGTALPKDPDRPTAAVSDEGIARMLLAGASQNEIMRVLPVGGTRVRAVRERLGVPQRKPGPVAAPLHVIFQRRTEPTDDGHLLWTAADHHLRTVGNRSISAARYAFRQKYRRDPIGKVSPGCGVERCVHPDHVEDRPMREALTTQLNAIFGGAR